MVEHAVTINQLAMYSGMDHRFIAELLRGGSRSKGGYLQLQHAFALEYVTQGAIQAYEWLEDPIFTKRIRESRMTRLQEFERAHKRLVLQFASMKQPEAMVRYKARVLSRVFNVQWGEVLSRAKHRAAQEALKERASIDHLLAPPRPDITDDGIIVSDKYPELSNDDWLRKVHEDYEGQPRRQDDRPSDDPEETTEEPWDEVEGDDSDGGDSA